MLKRSILILIGAICFVFISCQKNESDLKVSPETETPSTGTITVNNATLLQLVNAVRQSGCNCGSTVMPPVRAVTWNNQLATAAFNHSNDMYSNDYFSHTGLNGSNPGDRITAAGYTWRAYGENIAKGYTSEQSVIDGWIRSEGHCKNIMNSFVKEMGVARAGNFWTQEFGSR